MRGEAASELDREPESSPPEALTKWRRAYAADDRHRSDVHLLRQTRDADGDRVRLRLRPLDPPRGLHLRSRHRRPGDADPDSAAVPAPAHARPPWAGPPALGGRPPLRPGESSP